jgi:hypothetical protein
MRCTRHVVSLGHPTGASTPVNCETEQKPADEMTLTGISSFVLRNTFIFHPFTQTTEGNTSRLAYTSVWIIKTGLYYRPYVFHDGYHVFTATFDRHTEGEHRATAEVCIWGLEVLLNKGPKRGEDLGRGESCG